MTIIVCFAIAFILLLFAFSTFDAHGDMVKTKSPYYFDLVFYTTYENGRGELFKMYKPDYGALFTLVENRAAWLDTKVLNILDVSRNVTIQ